MLKVLQELDPIERSNEPLPRYLLAQQEPDSTWTTSPQQLCLITLLDNTSIPALSGHVRGVPLSDENVEPSAVMNKKSSWGSTAFVTAKPLLRGVRIPQMPFVRSSLLLEASILSWKIARYRLTPTCTITALTGAPANEGERANERVVGISGECTRRAVSFTCFRGRCRGTGEKADPGTVSLHSPSPRVGSQTGICRKLEDIRQELAPLGEQEKIKGFFSNVENADKLGGLVEDVRDAVMDYQACVPSNNLSPRA